MKLAEALLLRADLQRKIDQLNDRILPNLIVHNQANPQEDPTKLLAQLRDAIGQLERIAVKVNNTNIQTLLPDGRSLMEGLAKRDAIKMLQSKMYDVRRSSTIRSYGHDNQTATLKFPAVQSEIDQLGRSFREIDTIIQRLNWNTDLIE
jgi:hypothetical protein